MDEKIVGVVVALKLEGLNIEKELGSFTKKVTMGDFDFYFFRNKKTIFVLVYSGVGELSASIATTLLITNFKASLILNFGLCGSLSPSYKLGDVVLCNEVVHYDFHPDTSDPAREAVYLGRSSPVFNVSFPSFLKHISSYPFVRIASGDKFIALSDMKEHLRNKFNCSVCDMESAGINLSCSRLGIECILIKAVSDNADESAQTSFEDSIKNGVSAYENLIIYIAEKLNE